jgi:hypothetical protein
MKLRISPLRGEHRFLSCGGEPILFPLSSRLLGSPGRKAQDPSRTEENNEARDPPRI